MAKDKYSIRQTVNRVTWYIAAQGTWTRSYQARGLFGKARVLALYRSILPMPNGKVRRFNETLQTIVAEKIITAVKG